MFSKGNIADDISVALSLVRALMNAGSSIKKDRKRAAGKMIRRFAKFKESIRGLEDQEDQYVMMVGTACGLIMENEKLPFHAAKSINTVLTVGSMTVE